MSLRTGKVRLFSPGNYLWSKPFWRRSFLRQSFVRDPLVYISIESNLQNYLQNNVYSMFESLTTQLCVIRLLKRQ